MKNCHPVQLNHSHAVMPRPYIPSIYPIHGPITPLPMNPSPHLVGFCPSRQGQDLISQANAKDGSTWAMLHDLKSSSSRGKKNVQLV